MLKLIRNQLLKIVEDIDAGNSNLTEEEEIEVAKILKRFTTKDRPMSKYEAYTYLGISRDKFDNLVREGKLPQGKKQQGFKELSWTKKELDKYTKQFNIN